ncbi:dihydrodipicolinate synthase family protein [Phycicoccus sp. DTK01]|uniref:dihydrodipicolinate synthase family protein n=1 Tax=Phycicoccus sp. DTK01 TaxID=2785745 RepID=UPI001A904345|nr:dihydrodipicolinate synthase family protein [Phycicoccus sp. DTK01]GIL36699.1 hypothetical protein PDTK01_27740 [Phycicoccus sp. DTK01]
MRPALLLPDGGRHELSPATTWTRPEAPLRSRVAYAAAHVVPRVDGENVAGAPAQVDWDATIAIRRELWSWGLGVAEAMDTAQRGMGLDWPAARELIRRSAAAAAEEGGRIAAGAGTDQLDLAHLVGAADPLDRVVEAYREQVGVVEEAGATVIVMASRALAAVASSARDYLDVYGAVLEHARRPVILHWLGEMFDPALSGYWGSTDVGTATQTFLGLLRAHADRVDGVKVSLLDADHERALRAALPEGVRLYTGDDFNFPELVCPDDDGRFSDALLGVFAAIAPAASAALQRLDDDDPAEARRILDSTRELGRHLFEAPTYHYKVGIAFLAWLNGVQPGFQMVGGLASNRSVAHLTRLTVLADRAGLLRDPALAADRFNGWSTVMGVRAGA